MSKIDRKVDREEAELLVLFNKGQRQLVACKSALAQFKAAARATAIKDRQVNIRLSSGDLSVLQTKALVEGIPYQTLIASVQHKYGSGRLTERHASGAASSLHHPML